MKQSGGSIEVYSELNHGTTFKIYLPRAEAAAQQLKPPVRHAGRLRGSERILLVEDDDLVRKLAANILNALGYTVRAIEKQEEVEAILQDTVECDLLLTDVVMPMMSGPELVKRVAERWPNVRVLYMSGYAANAVVHHGVLEKNASFLPKPFTPEALAAKVREVLDADRS